MKKLCSTALAFIAIIFASPTAFAAKTIYSNTFTYTDQYNTASFTVSKESLFSVKTTCEANAKKHTQNVYVQHYSGSKWTNVKTWKQSCKTKKVTLEYIASKGGWYRVRVIEPKPPVKTTFTVKVSMERAK